jgi:hypothetical protein
MQIKYKIIEVNSDEQQIVVRFYSDEVPEASLASQVDGDGNMLRCRTDVAISLPLPTPSGAELEAIILQNCPVNFFKIKAAVADLNQDTSMSEILPMVGLEVIRQITPLVAPSNHTITPTVVPVEVL